MMEVYEYKCRDHNLEEGITVGKVEVTGKALPIQISIHLLLHICVNVIYCIYFLFVCLFVCLCLDD